jgi:hypothetical protein
VTRNDLAQTSEAIETGEEHSLPNGRKRGRPRDPILQDIRRVWLPMRSERTQARYKKAMEQLIALGMPLDQVMQTIKECCRPSGSLNVNLFARYAAWVWEKETKGGE